MNGIGWAVKELKMGARVRRTGWNGKGMWLALSPGVRDNPSDKFWSPAIREFGKQNAIPSISVLPYIVKYTATREIVPWLCSQTDILALDWELA